MATKPLPQGTRNLTVNVPRQLHAQLAALADRSGMSVSEYCRRILIKAAEQGTTYRQVWEEVQHGTGAGKPAAGAEQAATTRSTRAA